MSRQPRLHEVEVDDVVNPQLLQGDHLPPGVWGLGFRASGLWWKGELDALRVFTEPERSGAWSVRAWATGIQLSRRSSGKRGSRNGFGGGWESVSQQQQPPPSMQVIVPVAKHRIAHHTRTDQRTQYPSIKEYTLNHNIKAPIIQGIFLN